ncbi:YihY/virulence factor BrkB family protein [Gemmatimonadota bacterium]
MKKLAARTRGIIVESSFRWFRHGAPTLSAAMAFYALTSMAPLLVIAVSIAGIFLGPDAVRVEVVAQIEVLLGPSVASLVDEMTRGTWTEQPGLLAGGISLGVFLFTSTIAMEHLRDSLNKVWEIPVREGELLLSLLRGRLFSFALVLAVGVVLLSSLILRLGVSTLDQVIGRLIPFDFLLFRVSAVSTSFLGLTVMFALMFRFLPDARTSWRTVWVGAAATGCMFLAGEMLIGLYLDKLGVASFYGAIGSVVVLLFWIYYSSMVLLWGAEFTCVYGQHRAGRAAKTTQAGPCADEPPGPAQPGKG